jgi:predicted O-methyltransferase YrrM
MAHKTKLSVAFAHFPYGGNGATSSEHPDIRHWEVETVVKMKADDRIERFSTQDFSDTPITMTRNRALRRARDMGFDLLLMVDSDQSPSRHAGEHWYRPFWDVAFNFIYENYHKGPRLIFAPYCGPPNDETGGENIYVFQWRNIANLGSETPFSLEQYTREQAAIMTGIHEAAAGPTGMLLIDLRLLDLIEPSKLSKREVMEQVQAGKMSVDQALLAIKEGYCYYEWKDGYADQKASTEDVTLTRDIALAGVMELGYNPVFCAWDSWIGHHKPWNVGKPQRFTSDDVGDILKKAALKGQRANEAIINCDEVCFDLNAEIEKSLGKLPRFSVMKTSNGHASGVLAPRDQEQAAIAELHRKMGIPEFGGQPAEIVGSGGRVTTGRWHAHGHAPEEHRKVLADLVRTRSYLLNRPIRVMEVGTWLGGTAVAMADAIADKVVVHCVDHWRGSDSDLTRKFADLAFEEDGEDAVYKKFLENVGHRLNKTIFPWRGTSAERSAQSWQQFDIIFIDAEHTYEGCKNDILNWWQHLSDDGVMIGHDFLTHGYDGVDRAVKEIFGEQGFIPVGWHPQGCLWQVEKRNHPRLELAISDGCFGKASPLGPQLDLGKELSSV